MRLINIEDEPLLKTVSVGGLSAKALWRLIKSQRTIKAIPVDWIKDYIDFGVSDKLAQHDMRFVSKMIEEWEKENETKTDRC